MSKVYIILFMISTITPRVLMATLDVRKMWNETSTSLNLPEGSPCTRYTEEGVCVNVYRCMKVLVSVENLSILPLCSFKNGEPIVCCTNCDLVDDIRELSYMKRLGIFPRTPGSISHRKCLQYLEDLPYACKGAGLALFYDFDIPNDLPVGATRCTKLYVIGGWTAIESVDALRGEFPHMALLGYGPDVESAQYHCGGTVISQRHVLTAGHCISSQLLGPVKYVAVGILKRTDPPELWRRHEVDKIIPHPEYQSPSKYHDIALLTVKEEITFDAIVLPACLNTDRYENIEEISSDTFLKNIRKILKNEKKDTFATGWGRLGENSRLAETLQKVQLEAFLEEECSSLYPEHRHMLRGFDNTTQMCYGKYLGFADTCTGDSGGPLQLSIRANAFHCQHKVVGVVSSGNTCGLSIGSAGLYTRVQYYIPWIESIVWPNEK